LAGLEIFLYKGADLEFGLPAVFNRRHPETCRAGEGYSDP